MTAARWTVLGLTVLTTSACGSSTGPDPDVPASVTVSPSTALLLSIGDTVALSATVRNGGGQGVAVAVTWSSEGTTVATVDGAGRVVAIGNGTANIRASARSALGNAVVTVRQAVDSVAATGTAQAADVGSPLDSSVVVTLRDARGHPVTGAPVSFEAGVGGGRADPAQTTTDASGAAFTTWTLGPEAGLQELDVVTGFDGENTRMISATGFPLAPASLSLFAGDGQTELASRSIPAPLQVRVLDSLGNAVPGVSVVFVVSGDALLDTTEAFTDLDGVASMGLTLGSTNGTYSVSASVPDSLTATGLGLVGSPVNLTADAVPYAVDLIGDLGVGDTVIVTGTGFHPVADSNVVSIGGEPLTILESTQTTLRVKVPDFGCTPLRVHDVAVSRDGQAASQPVAVYPRNALDLDVGEKYVLDDPADHCLQFPPGSNQEYLVGLTATAWFDGGTSFVVTARDSVGPFPPSPSAPASASPAMPARSSAATGGEAVLRAWEEQWIPDLAGGGIRSSPAGPAAVLQADGARHVQPGLASVTGGPALSPPIEGDILDLRLPDLRVDPCLAFVPVSTEVFSVGPRLALATSEPLPSPGSPAMAILLDAVNTLHTSFGTVGINLVMGLLGEPAGWDADTRVTVVLTPRVDDMGLPAYASAVDHLPRATCPSSDEGLYIYVAVPEAASAIQLAAVLANAAPDLTHHTAHTVQWSRRIPEGGNLLPSWIGEGQAELAVEHVGLILSGRGGGADHGISVVNDLPRWVGERFDRLARFQGWDGGSGTVAGAPEACSLFGFGGSVCGAESGPGAAWSFMRYVSDRFGPLTTGGEPGLNRAIVDLEPNGDPVAGIETMLGTTIPDLITDWAATLYADGRLTPGEAPGLQMTSWRLPDVYPSGPRRLTPDAYGFDDFTRAGGLVGGGTAYTLISSPGTHGPLAVSVTDGAGGMLAEVLAPRVWVVRMR